MKFRKILSVLLIVVMLASLAGCNYITRPWGAANNGEDISSKLSDLLIIPSYNYEQPEEQTKVEYIEKEEEPEPEDPPVEEEPEPEDPVLTPFTSTYDAAALLSKIGDLISNMQVARGVANSATGVSDELLAGRSIKILVPDNFPISEEEEAVKALAAQYGCAVNVKRMGTGTAYTAACRRAVLSGDKVDLMYVDNSVWGDIHSFTQPVNSFINMELGDELGTFSSVFSQKFYVADDLDNTVRNYYVASGIGAPYLLAYNKNKVATATVAEGQTIVEDEPAVLRAIEVTDPVEMYNSRTWSISALNAVLEASTKDGVVGLASQTDTLAGLDIWYGMEGVGGFNISSTTGKAAVKVDAKTGKTVDMIQDWYWNTKGADAKNYVGSLVKASAWDDKSVYQKLFDTYTGNDVVNSFAFAACEVTDLVDLKTVADEAKASWDFVAYPYGITYENTYRVNTADEFAQLLADDEANAEDPEYEQAVITPVAGWAGGFAVMKTCENPSVALRVAEEYTKIWKDLYEDPAVKVMTDDQKARYEDMKANMAVSFVRAMAEKAADVNAVYPDVPAYLDPSSSDVGSSMSVQDPNKFVTERSNYMALIFFNDNAELATHAMYHKNEANAVYDPTIHSSWTAFMHGSVHSESDSVKNSGSMISVLNASLLPNSVLFNW